MASINRLRRELLFKVVFYGPGLGGKTTTLQYVHAATKPENRGNMVSLATDTDRTLYFDFLPVRLLQVGDVTVKLQLYTVPGQVYYAATRKLVLSGADGIVFVADTQSARLDANLESLEDLNANLAEQGRKLSSLPHVFQWNKRDLPNLVPLDELDRRLNLFGVPSRPTIATTGHGVFDLLEDVTRQVVDAYRAELPVTAAKAEGIPLFLDAEEVGLAGAIQGLADSQPVRSPPTARLGVIRTPARDGTDASAPGRSVEASPPGLAALAAPLAAASPLAAAPHAASSAAFPVAASQAAASPIAAPPMAASPPAASPAAAVPQVGLQAAAAEVAVEARVARLAPPVTGAFSFADLWPAVDQDAARRVEHAIGRGDVPAAVSACEDLVSSVLAAGALMLGGKAHPDPALIVALLGLDGRGYLAFRAAARSARAKRALTARDALECYAFAIEARRRLDRAR